MNSLFVLCVLLQDQSAEETFKKIGRRIENAKTLTIRYTHQKEDSNATGRGWGTLLIKEGNKAWYAEDFVGDPETWWVSNGERVQYIRPRFFDEGILASEQQARESKPVSKELENDLRVLILSAGLALRALPWIVFEFRGSGGYSKSLRVSQFREEKGDAKTKAIGYSLTMGEDSRPFDVTLWYDPQSLTPAKRRTKYVLDDGSMWTSTETYSEFALDAHIPDEKFNLPEE